MAVLACVLVAGLFFVTFTDAHAEMPAELGDPLPLARIPLDPEQLPKEMERVRKGLLVQLPRAEFEELVRQAAQAQATLKQAPRLIEARYRARLEGTALVGAGQWKLIHPGPAPAVLSLDPFNLFLGQPRFENADALVGDFDGKGPGLLLQQSGARSVALDWTARGESGPEGMHFDLKTPSCPLASLELDLPADRRLTVSPDGCLVSSPQPADKPDRRLWKVGFAGRSQIHLLIQPSAGPDQPAPLILASLKATQELTPDLMQAEYQFDVQAPRHSIRELICECDPALRPYEVHLSGLESWELRLGAKPGSPHALVVRLHEPIQSGLLVVRCLAPLSNDRSQGRTVAWKSPGMRLMQAVPRGETLTLRLHSDVSLEDWQPNGFHLIDSTVLTNGDRVLNLSGGGIVPDERDKTPRNPDTATVSRPSARLPAPGADYRARTLLWWQVDSDQPALTAQIAYEVLQGNLFQLPVQAPPGWEVERVEMTPSALLRNWGVRVEDRGSLVTVDLNQALTPPRATSALEETPAPPRLTLRLRPARRPAITKSTGGGAQSWSIPEVIPVGARWPEGALAIECDQRAHQASIQPPRISALPEEEGPWGKQLPDYYYPYRGRALKGTLELRAIPTRLRARCVNEVLMESGRLIVETHLQVESAAGVAEALEFVASAPLGNRWSWRTDGAGTVRGFEPLPAADMALAVSAMGSRLPFQAVSLLAAQPWGQRWRLTLTQPPRPHEPLTLHFRCEVPSAPGDQWNVPLLSLVGTDTVEGETSLRLAPTEALGVETRGLQEVFAEANVHVESPRRRFRNGPPPLSLILTGDLTDMSRRSEARIRRALLITEPLSDHIRFVYRVRIENWREPNLTVALPAEMRLVEISRDGEPIRPTISDDPGGPVTVGVPISGDGPERTLHDIKIVYVRDHASGSLWARLEAPAPALPTEPLLFRRIWRLPPAVRPLLDHRLAPLPGASAENERLQARTDELFELLPDRLLSLSRTPEWEARQRLSLAEAATGLRSSQIGKTLPFREVLERLAFELLEEPSSVVVHASALREAGIGPETPLQINPAKPGQEAPLWENLGLVYVPCRAAPLLTTRRQWELWQADADGAWAIGAAREDAVVAAVARGHDVSGRYRTVSDWLRSVEDPSPGTRTGAGAGSSYDLLPGWTEWESVPGDVAEDNLLVIRKEAMTTAGLGMAAALVIAFGFAWRWLGRWRLRVLILWLAAGGLAGFWLPSGLQALAWWPWTAGLVLAAGWYVGWALFTPAPPALGASAAKLPASTAAAVLALLSFAGLASWAAPTSMPTQESITVFLVPGPPDAPDKQTVLIPADLVEKLDVLAHPPGGAPRGVVLLSASYEGKITGKNAEFEAVYQAQSFEDRAVTLTLPLTGVQLQDEVLLDGATAYPTALGPQGGYSVKIEGRGAHTLRVRFRVGVQADSENREFQFVAPRLTQSRLVLTLPSSAGDPHVPARQGEQRVLTTPEATRLEADLGRIGTPVLVRWRQEVGPSPPPVVEVGEAYLWDLRADASALRAVLRYNVIQGRAKALDVEIPESVEVRSVETRSPGRGKQAARLKEWQVRAIDRQRRLHLEFQNAVAGEALVALELVPRQPFGSTASLPLPTPLDAQPVQGFLAYRLDGLQAQVKDLAHLAGPKVEEFSAFWKAGGEDEPSRLAAAFAITRKPESAPFLRLQLQIPTSAFHAKQAIAWRVGSQEANFQATARFDAPRGDLILAEWTAPSSLVVARVSGRHVWHWSQTGSRIQVWFQQAVDATDVQLSGWLPVDERKNGQEGTGKELQGPTLFNLPCLRLPSATTQTSTVRIGPAPGLGLAHARLRNLLPLPDAGGANQEHAYLARESEYGGTLEVSPLPGQLETRMLTTAERRERQITFVVAVDVRTLQGEPRDLVLRLDDWEGDVRLEAGNGAHLLEQRRDDSSRSWSLGLQPGQANPYRVTLTLARPLDEGAANGIPVPRVSVVGANRTEQWFAVQGKELAPTTAPNLTPISSSAQAAADWQKAWPADADRLRRLGGAAWKVSDGGATLRVSPRSGSRRATPIHLFLVEHTIALADGKSWVHQATCWLYHQTNADLGVSLPAGAKLVRTILDGAEVAPLTAGADVSWFRLPLEAGACRVSFLWKMDPDRESLDKPLLQLPRFEGAAGGQAVWTLQTPQDYRSDYPAETPEPGAMPATRAEVDLRRAEAQLRLSAMLAEQTPEGPSLVAQLGAAQQRFYQHCRFAEHELALSPSSETSWLQQLRDENKELARTHGFERTRAEAERTARAGQPIVDASGKAGAIAIDELPERGTPAYWQGAADAAAPQPKLEGGQAREFRYKVSATLALLCVIVAGGVLSHFPRALLLIRCFWPEQLALLGCVIWLANGPGLVVYVLVRLAILGRLLELGLWGYRHWRRPAAVDHASANGHPSAGRSS
jgi:hypothetical protein